MTPVTTNELPPGFVTPQRFREDIEDGEQAGYLLADLVPLGGVVQFVGPSYNLKSVFSAALWAAMSAGVPLAGRQVERSAAVYLILEHRGADTLATLDRAAKGAGLPGVDRLDGLLRRRFDLDDEAEIEAVLKGARMVDAKVIFVDCLRRATRGEENGSADSSAWGRSFAQLTDGGNRTVIVLHHSNHAGAPRGSTDIPAWADLSVLFSKVGEVLTLHAESHVRASVDLKLRVSFEGDAVTFRPVVASAAGKGEDSEREAQAERAREAVLAAVAAGKRTTTALREAVGKRLHVRNDIVDAAVRELATSGFIVDDGTERMHRWRCADHGSTAGRGGAAGQATGQTEEPTGCRAGGSPSMSAGGNGSHSPRPLGTSLPGSLPGRHLEQPAPPPGGPLGPLGQAAPLPGAGAAVEDNDSGGAVMPGAHARQVHPSRPRNGQGTPPYQVR